MILPDINVLVPAHNTGTCRHERSGTGSWASWPVPAGSPVSLVLGAGRTVVTSPHVFDSQSSPHSLSST